MAFAPQTLTAPGPIQACGTLSGTTADSVLTGTGSTGSIALHLDIVTGATISVSIVPNTGSSVTLLASKAIAAGDHLILDGLNLGNGDVLKVQSNQTDTTFFIFQSRSPSPTIQVVSSAGAVRTVGAADQMVASYYFTGSPAATNQAFFVATQACTIQAITEVHDVAAGGTSTLAITHETGTTAAGSGTDTLSADFNLNATARTPQNGALVAAQQAMAAGDRLSVKFNNAIQSSAGVLVTVKLTIP